MCVNDTVDDGFKLSAIVFYVILAAAVAFCLRISALVDLVLDDCRLEFMLYR